MRELYKERTLRFYVRAVGLEKKLGLLTQMAGKTLIIRAQTLSLFLNYSVYLWETHNEKKRALRTLKY